MILFYAAESNEMKAGIHRMLKEHRFDHPVMPFDSLDTLDARLRRPHPDVDIILICIGDATEMLQLTQMRSLLIDRRIVMILPRRDPDIVTWAHKLGPRFIAYADTGEKQVADVLSKMLGQQKRRKKLLHLTDFRQGLA